MKRIVSIALAALALVVTERAPAQASYSGGGLTFGGIFYPLEQPFYDHVMGTLLCTQSCANAVAPADTNALLKAGDPLVLATANEVRQVVDLDTWSPVGLQPLK